jgi:hypothetical protein
MASHFMQLPDLEGVQTVLGAGYDAAQKVIDSCLKDNDYEYWQTIDLQQLESEIVKQMNVLISVGDDEKYIKRLGKLLDKVNDEKTLVNNFLKPTPPPPPPEPMKDKAFDSGQIKGLTELLEKVNMGTLSPEQGGGVLMSLFPGIPKKVAAEMIQKVAPQQMGAGNISGASPQGGSGAQTGTSAPDTGNQMAGGNNA